MSGAWYLLMLHNKLKDITKKNFKARLEEIGELDMQVLGTRSKLRRHASDEGSIAGDEPAAAGMAGAGAEAGGGGDAPAGAEAGGGGDATASSSSSSEKDIAPAEACVRADYVIPEFINGCKVGVEVHPSTGASGLRIKCFRHIRCRKFCSLDADPFGLGPAHAELFLGAWSILPLEDNSREGHKAGRPTKAQIIAYRDGSV